MRGIRGLAGRGPERLDPEDSASLSQVRRYGHSSRWLAALTTSAGRRRLAHRRESHLGSSLLDLFSLSRRLFASSLCFTTRLLFPSSRGRARAAGLVPAGGRVWFGKVGGSLPRSGCLGAWRPRSSLLCLLACRRHHKGTLRQPVPPKQVRFGLALILLNEATSPPLRSCSIRRLCGPALVCRIIITSGMSGLVTGKTWQEIRRSSLLPPRNLSCNLHPRRH